jgi:hypothetical protein
VQSQQLRCAALTTADSIEEVDASEFEVAHLVEAVGSWIELIVRLAARLV